MPKYTCSDYMSCFQNSLINYEKIKCAELERDEVHALLWYKLCIIVSRIQFYKMVCIFDSAYQITFLLSNVPLSSTLECSS